jgi:predicted N-acetyltransferase YhbS
MITSVEKFGVAHIKDGLSLCRKNHWNQVQNDWRLLLELSPDGCRVVKHKEEVVGSVSTINYHHLFSWVGMLLVDPAYQRKGIGSKLLNTAMDILSDEETIKLDATPAGRALYLQMHFKDEYPLMRMQSVATVTPEVNSYAVEPMEDDDLAEVSEIDRVVFGADRKRLLYAFRSIAPELAFVIKQQNKIVGYCLGRKGYSFDQVGPVIASEVEMAKCLAAAAIRQLNKKPVIIDALQHNNHWTEWLNEAGFKEQRPFIRMYKGSNKYPGAVTQQFAIAGPEFG